MTTRKTLALNPEAATTEAPALKKKGRGWEISDKRLDALHEQARELRRHSSEAHKALAAKFSKADLGRYTFKRHAVVGSAIVDFNCHNLGLALAIDEEGQNDRLAQRRDKSLESVGIKVMRIAAADILTDIDAVLQRLTVTMRERIAVKKEAVRAHKAANPKQTYSRPKPRAPRND
jgi:very-short-patch-repair endonuclease